MKCFDFIWWWCGKNILPFTNSQHVQSGLPRLLLCCGRNFKHPPWTNTHTQTHTHFIHLLQTELWLFNYLFVCFDLRSNLADVGRPLCFGEEKVEWWGFDSLKCNSNMALLYRIYSFKKNITATLQPTQTWDILEAEDWSYGFTILRAACFKC